MATVTLNLYTKAYPAITNRIRCAVLAADGVTIVASQIDTTVGHPQRTWAFAGLPRVLYGVTLDEIDGSGNPLANLALFDVAPGVIDGSLIRDDEEYQVDAALSGMVSGTNTATFDGTGGKPDFRGWSVVFSELTGRGILAKNDYTWDPVTGIFTLVALGDFFQASQYWNFHFNPKSAGAAPPSVAYADFTTRLITVADDDILADDFANALLVEPPGFYTQLFLPSIAAIPTGRPVSIEVGGSVLACAEIIPNGTDVIKFLGGRIIMLPGESLQIYAYDRAGVKEWRVKSIFGNFAKVGQEVNDDAIQSFSFSRRLLNGDSVQRLQYARLYHLFVLNLPLTQVCNYDDHATGNNKYIYSFANSSNPAFANQFFLPDRRGMYQRNNNTGKAGDFQDAQVGQFTFNFVYPTGDSFNGHPYPPTALGKGLGINAPVNLIIPTTFNTGLENNVKSYLINKYVSI